MAEETVMGTMEEKETEQLWVGGWKAEACRCRVPEAGTCQTCGCGEQEGTKGGGRAG